MPITCYDGSLAPSYDQCPDISTEWDIATGIGIDPATGTLGTGVSGDPWAQPSWWDDPGTLDKDERAEHIYQLAGGIEKTGLDFDAFWAKYETDFPTWEESGYAAIYENVLEQLGMLNTSIRLASEGFNIDLDSLNLQRHAKVETALSKKEDIGGQMESQFIGTGGVVSGRRIEKAEDVSENITQALGMEFRGINIEKDLLQISYEGELVDIEDRKIDYENTLIGIEDDYEKHLFDLVNLMDIQKTEPEVNGNGENLCTEECAENCAPPLICNHCTGECQIGETPPGWESQIGPCTEGMELAGCQTHGDSCFCEEGVIANQMVTTKVDAFGCVCSYDLQGAEINCADTAGNSCTQDTSTQGGWCDPSNDDCKDPESCKHPCGEDTVDEIPSGISLEGYECSKVYPDCNWWDELWDNCGAPTCYYQFNVVPCGSSVCTGG